MATKKRTTKRAAAGKTKRKKPATLHSIRFPGETSAYRSARDRLLLAEADLMRHVQKVADARAKLPAGGELKEDYVFDEGAADLNDTTNVRQVRLSELFEPGKDTLILYSFMYGPQMDHACPLCTSMIDSMNGAAPHVTQRVNLAVVAKSPIQRIRDHARGRGWNHLRLLSSANNTYNADYHGEATDGKQNPSLNVFMRRGGKIRHFYNTELLFYSWSKTADARHIDSIWPLWNLFDFTPEGRGTDWYPKLSYAP